MTQRHLPRLAGILAVGFCLFIAFTYLFFPTARIDAIINQALAAQGLSLSSGAHKTFLPGLAWNNPRLSSDQGELVKFDRLKVQLRLLPILMGQVRLGVSAELGAGNLNLEYGVTGAKALDLHIDSIPLTDIPFFKTVLGARMDGSLWSEGIVSRNAKALNGELKLEVKQLGFSGVKVGAFPLPDTANLRTQGMIKVTNGAARLESFTLQGDGIYMRLSGDLPGGANAANLPLNLILEIMPKPEFMEKQKLVFMLLAKFTASPGVYKVPIRGTMLRPVIL